MEQHAHAVVAEVSEPEADPLDAPDQISADSLQRRLEVSLDEIQRLKAENHQLREQAAKRLGERRVEGLA